MDKHFRAIITVITLALLVIPVFISGTAQAIEPVKLKCAAVFPPPGTNAATDIFAYWQNEVTKRTNGAITFETYWGGSLGAPADHIDLLKNGVIQVVQTHQWFTPSRMPFGEFEYVFPFGPTDYVQVVTAMRQIRGEFDQFRKELADNNAIMISDIPQPSYNMLSDRPITKIADFQGLKVALIGRYFGRWLPPGATPVVRPAPERYDMLKTGLANVDLNPLDNQYAYKLNEVSKYFIDDLTLLTACPMGVMMNLDTFNKFPPEIQKIFLEVGKETEMISATVIIPQWEKKIKESWRQSGIKWVKFEPEEKKKWINDLPDIPAEWAKEMESQGLPGFELVQRWQEITKQLGYKWDREWGIKK